MMLSIVNRHLKLGLLTISLFLCLGLTSCNTINTDDSDSDNSSFLDFKDDTDKAVGLIHEANRNLKSIRTLYNKNNPKIDDLKKALAAKDIKKVKEISDGLSLVIIDGYVLAESAKEKIDKAKNIDGINDLFKDYLQLKSESLELQIKAFNYRRNTAKLFRDEFGTENETQLEITKNKFIANEKKFAEYRNEAKKRSDAADKIWSDSKKKDAQ